MLKNKLSLDINEVGVANLRVSGHHLVISFADGNIKMFDLKRRYNHNNGYLIILVIYFIESPS